MVRQWWRNAKHDDMAMSHRDVMHFFICHLRSKFSSFGGGGAVSDVAIGRFWCFGGDMTETAATDLVGMV